MKGSQHAHRRHSRPVAAFQGRSYTAASATGSVTLPMRLYSKPSRPKRGLLDSMLMSPSERWVAPRFLSGWVWVRGESPKFSHDDALVLSRQLLSSNLMLHEGGASLGLVITDATVALHGGVLGSILAEGIGSLLFFWVLLPQEISRMQRIQSVFEGSGESNEQRKSKKRKYVKCLLVVDDDRAVLMQTTRMLQKLGSGDIRIESKSSGEDAIQFLKDVAATETTGHAKGLANWVVIMDNNMGGISGIEATRVIMSDSAISKCTVVGHTGDPTHGPFQDAGAKLVYTKPMGKQGLRDMLRRVRFIS